MIRLNSRLYPVVTFGMFVLTGVVFAQESTAGLVQEPYDMRRLGLGTKTTLVLALSTDCKPCLESVEFYKSLMTLPGIDGIDRRVVVVAMDGVWPLTNVLKPLGFKPHRLTSGPYMHGSLPGVSEPGTILLLDGEGKQIGKWSGSLSAEQKREIIEALTRK